MIMLLLLLLLSRFSRVRLCATPEMAAHQAPRALGFFRQEHWSGLPFPSPMHESEKWKWSRSVVSDFATPWTAAYQAPLPMGFSRQEYWSGVPLPSPSIPEYISKQTTKTANLKRYMHPNVHCKTIYNSKDVESTKVSINRGRDKEGGVHMHSGILLSHKRMT